MSATAIMKALLAADPNVTAIVGNRIFVGVLPQGTLMPAVGVSEVSVNEVDTVARRTSKALVTARVQVTALTKSYPAQKQLLRACKLIGGGTHTGVVAGYQVLSVMREAVGPDMPVEDDGIYEQSRDFMIAFLEDN